MVSLRCSTAFLMPVNCPSSLLLLGHRVQLATSRVVIARGVFEIGGTLSNPLPSYWPEEQSLFNVATVLLPEPEMSRMCGYEVSHPSAILRYPKASASVPTLLFAPSYTAPRHQQSEQETTLVWNCWETPTSTFLGLLGSSVDLPVYNRALFENVCRFENARSREVSQWKLLCVFILYVNWQNRLTGKPTCIIDPCWGNAGIFNWCAFLCYGGVSWRAADRGSIASQLKACRSGQNMQCTMWSKQRWCTKWLAPLNQWGREAPWEKQILSSDLLSSARLDLFYCFQIVWFVDMDSLKGCLTTKALPIIQN